MMMSSRKIVLLSLFLTMAIIVNIVENVSLPVFFVPGVKLGLANIVAILLLYLYGFKDMFIVNILRIFVANIVLGTLFSTSFFISVGSSLSSMILVYLFIKLDKLSIFGISMIQAIFFNIFQIVIVSLFYNTFVFMYYLPYLVFSGIITGYIVALIATYIAKIMKTINVN